MMDRNPPFSGLSSRRLAMDAPSPRVTSSRTGSRWRVPRQVGSPDSPATPATSQTETTSQTHRSSTRPTGFLSMRLLPTGKIGRAPLTGKMANGGTRSQKELRRSTRQLTRRTSCPPRAAVLGPQSIRSTPTETTTDQMLPCSEQEVMVPPWTRCTGR